MVVLLLLGKLNLRTILTAMEYVEKVDFPLKLGWKVRPHSMNRDFIIVQPFHWKVENKNDLKITFYGER